MAADVTLGGGAQHGVAQGMDGNIAIRVCLQSPVMGYTNATEHHVVAIAESVNVQPLSNPELHLSPP
jgi:hypothetical protein